MMKITDFHTHVLPGIDDGSANLEMSVSMLQRAWAQGVDTMVATPHFYAHNDKPEEFLARRADAQKQLRDALTGREDVPELKMGAEVYYFPGISDADSLSQLAIEGTRYILVEMPLPPWSDHMYFELENIFVKRGLTPIVAHVDRYIKPFKTYGIPARLARLPVLVQANAEFFINRRTQKTALRMLRKQQIHLLGSDCHDLTRRPPNLHLATELIRDRLGEAGIAYLHTWESEVLHDGVI